VLKKLLTRWAVRVSLRLQTGPVWACACANRPSNGVLATVTTTFTGPEVKCKKWGPVASRERSETTATVAEPTVKIKILE